MNLLIICVNAGTTQKKNMKQNKDGEKSRPPRPSDRVEVRAAIWNEKENRKRVSIVKS